MKYLKLFFLVVLICIQLGAAAQKDPALNVGTDTLSIIYPALTAREGKGLQLPVPPSNHPRLFLTPAYIPSLKQKVNSPLLQKCRNKILEAVSRTTDGYLPTDGKSSNNNIQVRDAIEAKALWYVLNEDKIMGRNAVDAVLHYYATLKINNSAQDITREIGRAIVTGCMVYDWCYPIISPDEKTILIARMETLATQMEIGWPTIHGSSITSHTVEAQLARDMLSLGIAAYNEKPVIYNRIAGRIFSEFLPARRFFYPAAYHHQGSAYGAYRFSWDMYSTIIFDRMGYPNLYGKDQAQIPYYFIYARRPDGQMIRNGDDYNEQFTKFGEWWKLGQAALLYAGTYHKDPIVINEAFKESKPGDAADYIFDFLFFDPKVYEPAAGKLSLPLTRYFKEPFGSMIARTGFTDGIQSKDVIAEMKIQQYNFSNHQHLDAGSFQLYYKGPLTVQSGIYQGTSGSYGSEHFKNYSQRTIAHNCMLIYDPNQKFKWHNQDLLNDGGQPYPNDAHEPENMNELMTQGYKTGEVLAHDYGPDLIKPEYSYLKGELAEAYGKKVKSFRRSFVFLNLNNPLVPAALIVFDGINSSNKDFKKTWLLHCVEEPVIAGNVATVKRYEKGYNAQLVNTTLLPIAENLLIHKVGGAGNEFSVGGKNFPQSIVAKNNSGDSAVWRIEVSPKNKSENDNFLNVMQVMDYNGGKSKPLKVEKFETAQFVGVKMGDRLVLFSKKSKLVSKPVHLKIISDEMTKVLITDLAKGNWKVECLNNKKNSAGKIINNNNLLYFKVPKGDYLITKE